MPSPYDGPNSSGVGDNAYGRMGGLGRRNSGMTGRQMRQYSQLRRDEMSHGAWLQNQNAALAFNRDSARIDANVQQADWTAERGIDQGKRYADAVPHATSADLINKKFGYDPRFAPDKPTDTGTPPPGNTPPPPPTDKPKNTRGKNATTKDVEAAVRAGHISPEEATGGEWGGNMGLSTTYSKKAAANAAANGGKSVGRQFTGPVTPPTGGGGVGTPIK